MYNYLYKVKSTEFFKLNINFTTLASFCIFAFSYDFKIHYFEDYIKIKNN